MARKKKFEIPITQIELEENNFHILIETELNKATKLNWLIDTGASKTVFDTGLTKFYELNDEVDIDIQSAGIGEGQIVTKSGIIEQLSIGETKIKNLDVALINLDHVNELYSMFTKVKIAGLIGSDFLAKYTAIIDYKKLKLTIYN